MAALATVPRERARELFPVPKPKPRRKTKARPGTRSCATQDCGGCQSCQLRSAWAQGRFGARRKGRHPEAWTPDQDARLRQLAGTRPVAEIAAALSEEFLPRTTVSVRIRATRLGLSLFAQGLSMTSLEVLFGVDHRVIRRRWVAPGLLAGRRWSGRGGHPGWWFEEAEVERFVREAPWVYEVGRMQKGHRLTQLAQLLARSDPWLSLAEAEQALHYAPGCLGRWLRRGLVPHKRRPGAGGLGAIVIRRNDLPAIRATIDAETARCRTEGAKRAHLKGMRRRQAWRVGFAEGMEAALQILSGQPVQPW